MNAFLTRARTLLTAVVTWLTLAGAVLGIVADELAQHAADGTVAAVLAVVGRLATAIVVAIAIVRRVTEVIPDDRGLLPVDHPIPAKSPVRDRGAVELVDVALGGALILAAAGALIIAF